MRGELGVETGTAPQGVGAMVGKARLLGLIIANYFDDLA